MNSCANFRTPCNKKLWDDVDRANWRALSPM
jgi:hypothetical protein